MKLLSTTILLLLCVNLAYGQGQVLIDTDFCNAIYPVGYNSPDGLTKISGVVPLGWVDNSSWAQVWVNYSVGSQDAIRYMRMDVSHLVSGRGQLTYALPTATEQTYYRLNFAARRLGTAQVQVGIRLNNSPYTFLWQTTPNLTSNIGQFEYTFSIVSSTQPINLMFVVYGEDKLDLVSLKLEKFTAADLAAELAIKYPNGSPRNLARITRFPLGLQSGWMVNLGEYDGSSYLVASDSGTKGLTSGFSTLKTTWSKPITLYSAPFEVPFCLDSHVASVWVKGSGQIKMSAFCGTRELGSSTMSMTPSYGWKKVVLAFTPMVLGPNHGLRFEFLGSGYMWIDALKIEKGTRATDYAAQLDCEVAFGMPTSDASAARIQFDDESPVINYCVTGAPVGSVLKLRVIDIYGTEVNAPGVVMSGAAEELGSFNYEQTGKSYGPFRVEGYVVSAAGQRISTYNEIVVYRLRRPHYWGTDAPNSPFGIHTYPYSPQNLAMVKAIGINWARLHNTGRTVTWWYYVEQNQGNWTFTDNIANMYRNAGLKLLGTLSSAPKWASYYMDVGVGHDSYSDCFYLPKNLNNWSNYVSQVVSHYKDSIDAWDVCNEPWWAGTFAISYNNGYIGGTSLDYCNLSSRAYQGVKAIDANMTVTGLQTGVSNPATYNWGTGVVASGGLGTCDVIAYHHYNAETVGFTGDAAQSGFDYAMSPVVSAAGQVNKPVWMTEGSPVGGITGNAFYKHTVPYDYYEDAWATADRIPRYIVSLLSRGVQKEFLYCIEDFSYFGKSSRYRALVTEDGFPHPSAAAHSTMAWLLEDTQYVKTISPAAGVYAYIFAGQGRSVAVLSTAATHAAYTPAQHQSCEVYDLFGNVRQRAPLSGTVVYMTTHKGIGLLEEVVMDGEIKTCEDIWRLQLGLAGDLNKDCKIDIADMKLLMETWLQDVAP